MYKGGGMKEKYLFFSDIVYNNTRTCSHTQKKLCIHLHKDWFSLDTTMKRTAWSFTAWLYWDQWCNKRKYTHIYKCGQTTTTTKSTALLWRWCFITAILHEDSVVQCSQGKPHLYWNSAKIIVTSTAHTCYIGCTVVMLSWWQHLSTDRQIHTCQSAPETASVLLVPGPHSVMMSHICMHTHLHTYKARVTQSRKLHWITFIYWHFVTGGNCC